MDDSRVHHPTLNERMVRAFLDGAQCGMVEARGYGLTDEEWIEARHEAEALYAYEKAERA